LKGCHEHYRAQVNRIKRNRAIIPAHEEVWSMIFTGNQMSWRVLIQHFC
jgi:hypothetical protein